MRHPDRRREAELMLEQLRWVWGLEADRSSRGRELALGIIAANGVLLALVIGPQAGPGISWWYAAPVALFTTSLIVGILALRPRTHKQVNMRTYQRMWIQLSANRGAPSHVAEALVEQLLQTKADLDSSPLVQVRNMNSRIIDLASWAATIFGCGVAAMVAATVLR